MPVEEQRTPTMLPCPDCNGTDLYIEKAPGFRWIECWSCGCISTAADTEAVAIARWNRR